MASLGDALVRELLEGRYIAALATLHPNSSIHQVSVWYWFDGTHIYVATSSRSRKALNLSEDPRISIMIDSRDVAASRGVSISGMGKIVTGDASRKYNAEIHRKYMSDGALADPKVGPVFAAWDDITIQITPSSVVAWDMRVLDRQALGNSIQNNPGYLLPLER